MKPESPCCFEIDKQIELRRLFDRQICRLFPIQYFSGVNTHPPIDGGEVRPIADQATCRRKSIGEVNEMTALAQSLIVVPPSAIIDSSRMSRALSE
jgi:hypothetical protein